MSNTYYDLVVPQMSRMLANLGKWLDAGVAYADKKKFEPAVLVQSRLAPDQYDLVKQVQSACDTAKFAAARLTGKEPPKHPDTEKTVDELRARIKTVLAYLETFKPADFDGAESRHVTIGWAPGKMMIGSEYLQQLAVPNFYFHVTTAYSILRHLGVEVGKGDFLGAINLRDALAQCRSDTVGDEGSRLQAPGKEPIASKTRSAGRNARKAIPVPCLSPEAWSLRSLNEQHWR